MAVKPNMTGTEQINVTPRAIDFVSRFGTNWRALMEILGIMRPIRKEPGTRLKAYRASIILQDGNIPEGEEIPFSQAAVEEVAFEDLTLEKFARAVSIEAVEKYGARNAVQRVDAAWLNELQSLIMGRFYNFLQTGTLTSTETTFQMAIAMAIGLVRDKFKKMHRDSTQVVVFVNTLDVYKYLGAANISIQNVFGMQYIENFLGAERVIVSSEIPQGKVIATPVENIDLYYINPADSEFDALGLNYVTDGITNLIGFAQLPNYGRAIGEAYALMGMKLWAEFLDAIAVVSVGSTQYGVTLNKAAATIAVGGSETLTVTKAPSDATIVWSSSDTSVATVSNGVVTGVAKGTVTITASNETGGASYGKATCTVTVQDVQETVNLNKSAASVAVAGTVALKATTYPKDASVTWASSDSTVATVSNGTVTGVKAGTANITATNGDAVATCVVTVTGS